MIYTVSRHLIHGDTFDDIFPCVLQNLLEDSEHKCSPRGSLIKEDLAVTLVLNNPRARLITSKKRNTNYGFGVGEFLWYWAGKRDLATMVYYNKRMKAYSDDGFTLNSAYGYRLKKVESTYPGINNESGSQWQICIRTLKEDPDSRRAVMTINWPGDEALAVFNGSKDVPCTLSLQFFIRNNELNLHAHMRSNDVMWGLTYDLFSFTLFQEMMLLELQRLPQFSNLKLGKYYHTAGSLHLYENHFGQADEIVKEYQDSTFLSSPMEPITSLEELEYVTKAEDDLRTKRVVKVASGHLNPTLGWMVEELNKHREKRNEEEKNG